jgi:methionine-gamma-lyase
MGVSLGDIHTLVYPRPKDGGIIRLSIGCEDIDDLLEDFELGLSFVPGPDRRS